MCEINEKDLEKAAGGLEFGNPFHSADSQDVYVDINGCCEYFHPKNYNLEKKCGNCCYCVINDYTNTVRCINELSKGAGGQSCAK